MPKRPTSSLIRAGLLVLATLMNIKAQTAFELIHNADKISHFASVEQITNYFSKAEIAIEPFQLKQFNGDHFLLAAYPYSGKDTIDLFCYVKYGDEWVVQMMYFHLRPIQRHLRAEEKNNQILIFCGEEEVVRLTPDVKLSSPTR